MKPTLAKFRFTFLLTFVVATLIFSTVLSATNDTLTNPTVKSPKFFVSVSAGYAWPGSNEIIGSTFVNDGQNNLAVKMIRGTFGRGITNDILFGYMIKPHLGFETGMFANWGSDVKTSEGSDPSNGNSDANFLKINSQGFLLGVCLTSTISKFEFAAHSDIILGINYKGVNRFVRKSGTDTYEDQWVYEGGIACGWKEKLSCSYAVNPKFKIGVEGFFSLHTWSPDKEIWKSHKLNETEEISSIPDADKTVTFSDAVSYSSVTGYSSNVRESVSFPLHAAGVSFFAAYLF